MDDLNNVTIVLINTYVAQASSDYSSRNENLKIVAPANATTPGTITNLTLDADDFDVTDYQEDDYILYTAAYVGAGGTDYRYEIQSIEPAEVLTGTVNSYSESDSVTIDGTKYSYVKTIAADATNGKDVVYSAGDEATVVLDANSNVIYVDEAVTDSGNWIYINEVAATSGVGSRYEADAFFTDGTNEVIIVKNWTDTSDNTYSDDIGKGETHAIPVGWYTYSVDSNNEYRLTSSSNSSSTTSATAGNVTTNGSVNVGQSTGATRANAATVFVVVDADDNISVYTGISNVPTIKANTGKTVTAYYTNNNSGYAKFVFVDAGSDATITDGVSSDSEYIYLLKRDSTNVDGDGNKYYTYKALVDGEETTVDLADTCSQNSLFTLYYNAKANSDGYINSMSLAENKSDVDAMAEIGSGKTNTEATVKYSDGVLTIDGNSTDADLVLDDNYTIYLVSAAKAINIDDGASYEVSELSGSGLQSMLNGYKITEGSYYVERVDSEANSAVATIYLYVNTVSAT